MKTNHGFPRVLRCAVLALAMALLSWSPAMADCVSTIYPSSLNFGPEGGTINMTVTAQSGCTWFVDSSSIWLDAPCP